MTLDEPGKPYEDFRLWNEDDSDLVKMLRLFWKRGVARVSPGALGMQVRGKPYEKSELKDIVQRDPGVKWDGDWMVEA
jgi:hypothetical protein